ncbi:MAG TPA: FtsX-like permease family protein [Bryobacterales bacterium]|nr:FtsX-like permease family protein [Bryobacterales bacterium]
MVNRLVWQNLLHRPVRTLLSIVAVGVEITLILTVVGLSHGMLEDSARRTRGVGADIVVRPSTTQAAMAFSSADLNEKLVDAFAAMPPVEMSTGTTVYTLQNVFQTVTGIDMPSFSRMCGGFRYLSGGPFQQPYDAIIDDIWARQQNLSAGQYTQIWNRRFRVVGVVEPGKLSRIFIPLTTMQDLMGWNGKLSQIYLKLHDPNQTADVAAQLKKQFPGYQIYAMSDFTALFSINNIEGLSKFITVIIGLAVIIGFLVVMLSMYTAILERTREIGILKSLGASQGYIVSIVIRETFLLALIGIGAGIGFSFGAKAIIENRFPILIVSLHPDWWLWAGLIAVGGALLGALYPAARAARQDPIAALAYE